MEILFWKQNVRRLNEKGMSMTAHNDCEIIEAYSDASADGYGGYVSLCAGVLAEGTEVVGTWDEKEKGQSSTWREAQAVERVLKSNVHMLKNKKVKWFTCNKNVKKILIAGSKKQTLQQVALEINEFCEESSRPISLEPEWIRRCHNTKADLLSRTAESDDWKVQSWIFNFLDQTWGPHTVDRCASNLNTHCDRFNSRWWCPRTEGVNAFDQSWKNESNWLVPPPRLILKAFKKLQHERAKGTMVIPMWKSAPFWSFLVSENKDFNSFVIDSEVLPQTNITEDVAIMAFLLITL